ARSRLGRRATRRTARRRARDAVRGLGGVSRVSPLTRSQKRVKPTHLPHGSLPSPPNGLIGSRQNVPVGPLPSASTCAVDATLQNWNSSPYAFGSNTHWPPIFVSFSPAGAVYTQNGARPAAISVVIDGTLRCT